MTIQVGQSKQARPQKTPHQSKTSHTVRRVRKDPFSLGAIPQNELTPKVQSAMSELMEEIDRLKDELNTTREKVTLLENIAEEDTLVPALNRRGFMKELERTLSYTKRYNSPACVLYIDIDHFKEINDTHGHQIGDQALLHITDFLHNKVRQSDIVARIGGDEFALILQKANFQDGKRKAEQLTDDIKNTPCLYEKLIIPLGISIGVSELQADDQCENIIDRADKEMYSLRSKTRISERTD